MPIESFVIKQATCSACGAQAQRSADSEDFDAYKGRLREDGWYIGSRGFDLCPVCAVSQSRRRNSSGRVERFPFIIDACLKGYIGEDTAVAYLGASVKRWNALKTEYLQHGTIDGEIPTQTAGTSCGSNSDKGMGGSFDGDEVH